MKNLIFSLIATVFIAMGAKAQDVINKSNPQDNAGAQHNAVVREYLGKYASENFSVEKTIELTNAICKSKGIEGPFLTLEQYNVGVSDIKNNFKNIVNKSSLSAVGKTELQKLFDFMLNNGFSGQISFTECIDYMLKLENEILKNASLTANDKDFLLKSTSVARHSICLWNDYYKANTSSKSNNSLNSPPRWVRWLIVGAADVAGGVAGGGAFSVASGAAASVLAVEVIDKAK
jgi:hypothetical protein